MVTKTIEVTASNYFSKEANRAYMSVSQFKAFSKCEFAALEEVNGNYSRAESTALLVGSYVDAYFEGTLDLFIAQHPEIKKRDGTLKADYVQAELIIERLKADPLFMEYMSGEKQVIFTGVIEGIDCKCKVDSFHAGKMIVDLKVMRDFKPVYSPGEGRLNFIEAWRYDLQGAVYQELVYQNTGKRLPFYIAGATKEVSTDLEIFEIPQEVMDAQLEVFKADVRRFRFIKEGLIEPERCGHCEVCRQTKKLVRPTTWEELNSYEL